MQYVIGFVGLVVILMVAMAVIHDCNGCMIITRDVVPQPKKYDPECQQPGHVSLEIELQGSGKKDATIADRFVANVLSQLISNVLIVRPAEQGHEPNRFLVLADIPGGAERVRTVLEGTHLRGFEVGTDTRIDHKQGFVALSVSERESSRWRDMPPTRHTCQ